jgi:hypothetical protein
MAITKKRPFAATDLVVAWQGGAVDIDGRPYVFERGKRLRGDHPVVKALGEAAFVLDGTPADEMPSVVDELVRADDEAARAVKAKAPPRIDPATPLRDLLVCRRAITMSKAGTCAQGAIVLVDDPIVALAPDAFRPLVTCLGARLS